MNFLHDRYLQYLLMLGFIVLKMRFLPVLLLEQLSAILAGKLFVVTKPLGFDQFLFK